MNDESGESMEPMEEVPLIRLGESLMETPPKKREREREREVTADRIDGK